MCKIDLDFCPVAGLYYATRVLLLELVPRGHNVQFCEISSKNNEKKITLPDESRDLFGKIQ